VLREGTGVERWRLARKRRVSGKTQEKKIDENRFADQEKEYICATSCEEQTLQGPWVQRTLRRMRCS